MLSRRCFLTLSSLFMATTPTWASLVNGENKTDLYAAAFSSSKTAHHFGVFDSNGALVWQTDLPERAHAPVVHPTRTVIGIVARRPGFFMNFYDVSNGKKILSIQPEKDHHFYGHALFTQDGKRLITQENHFPTGQGKIVIRRWPEANIIARYSSNGIGPHESVLTKDNVLIIANGGLKTHPHNDREILNLDTMAPNVTYLSLVNGKVLNQASNNPEHHQLSIRHLDVNKDGQVALGFQYQGPVWDHVPLVGLSMINSEKIEYLPMPESVRMRFKQYCGSVCFDESGDLLAISTPRGGFVAYWHVPSRSFIGIDNCRDVCGIAATGNTNEFFLTNGLGQQLISNPVQNAVVSVNRNKGYRWDNHLRKI